MIKTLVNYTGKTKELISHKLNTKYGQISKKKKKTGLRGGQNNTEITSEVTISVKCMIMQCGSALGSH